MIKKNQQKKTKRYSTRTKLTTYVQVNEHFYLKNIVQELIRSTLQLVENSLGCLNIEVEYYIESGAPNSALKNVRKQF